MKKNIIFQENIFSEVQKYLNLISNHLPCGSFIRYEKIYLEMQDARYGEDTELAQGIWQHELKRAQWDVVAQKADLILTTLSKDLQVSVWLGEAWGHLYGFKGICAGFLCISHISQTFWDGLHPLIEKEDPEARTLIYEWCDETYARFLCDMALNTLDKNTDTSHLTLNDWVACAHFEQQSRKANDPAAFRQKSLEKGIMDRSSFQEVLGQTPQTVRQDMMDLCIHLRQEVETLCTFLDVKMGVYSPRFVHINRFLNETQRLFENTSHTKTVVPAEPVVGNETFETAPTQSTIISERTHAYQALRDLSRFLASLDSHSPTPQLLSMIAQWEHLSLGEILAQMPQQSPEIRALLELLLNASHASLPVANRNEAV